ncbi:MAG: MerR family transcriptional regulator [Acidobacteria bacterium]|nr:MerR family transcriptional regulator [Acidobacteriota bacterium]
MGYRIGTIAKQTGLSQRTLRYYDQIGLVPTRRCGQSGYRLYDVLSLARLHRVLLLRATGLDLSAIKSLLDHPQHNHLQDLEKHLEQIDQQIHQLHQQRERLQTLMTQLRDQNSPDPAAWLDHIKELTMYETYYSAEQREALAKRAEQLGPQAIEAAQNAWPVLIQDVKNAQSQGLDPLDPTVVELAKRWKTLVDAFTGGDPGIQHSLQNLYAKEHANIQAQHPEHVPSRELMAYLQPALKTLS